MTLCLENLPPAKSVFARKRQVRMSCVAVRTKPMINYNECGQSGLETACPLNLAIQAGYVIESN